MKRRVLRVGGVTGVSSATNASLSALVVMSMGIDKSVDSSSSRGRSKGPDLGEHKSDQGDGYSNSLGRPTLTSMLWRRFRTRNIIGGVLVLRRIANEHE